MATSPKWRGLFERVFEQILEKRASIPEEWRGLFERVFEQILEKRASIPEEWRARQDSNLQPSA